MQYLLGYGVSLEKFGNLISQPRHVCQFRVKNKKNILAFTMEATFMAAFTATPYCFLQTFRNFVWFQILLGQVLAQIP